MYTWTWYKQCFVVVCSVNMFISLWLKLSVECHVDQLEARQCNWPEFLIVIAIIIFKNNNNTIIRLNSDTLTMFTVLSAWRKSFEQFTRFILNAAATIKRLATLTQLIGVSCYSLHPTQPEKGTLTYRPAGGGKPSLPLYSAVRACTPCLEKLCIFVSVRTSSNFHQLLISFGR